MSFESIDQQPFPFADFFILRRDMKKNIILMAMLILVLSACSTTPNVTWELSVTGKAVNEPMVFSYLELSKMNLITLEDVLMDRSVDEDEIGSWSGVALSELLEKCGAEKNYTSLTAVAVDGYSRTLLVEELENAIIALKTNGEWIQKVDPGHGPIRLVCPQTSAGSWVYQLTEIIVNK